MQISKSDFLLYLEAPLHLWAKKHDKLEHYVPSPYDLQLMEQGNQIEDLAIDYLNETVCLEEKNLELTRKKRFTHGQFQAEVDALVFDLSENVYDVYEIKSSKGVAKEHRYDVTFQYLVCQEIIPIRNFFLVHLDGDYVRSGEISISDLFTIECLDLEIARLKDEVLSLRDQAWEIINRPCPDGTNV